jgi:hypothetical protein
MLHSVALLNQALGLMNHWLMKSEPDVYSIDDLQRDGREMWDSIRNYQARNMMRDDMRIGDESVTRSSSIIRTAKSLASSVFPASAVNRIPIQSSSMNRRATLIQKVREKIHAGYWSMSNSSRSSTASFRYVKSSHTQSWKI